MGLSARVEVSCRDLRGVDAIEMDRRTAGAANVSQRIRLFYRTIDKELATDFVAWKIRQVEF